MKRSTALAALVMLGLAACGGGDDADDAFVLEDSVTVQPATPPAGGMDMGASSGMGVTAQLEPLNDSGIGGEVTVTDRGAETEVMVRLTGATAEASHPGHIHSGSCQSVGSVVQPLQPIAVDATGTGTMTTSVAIAPATVMDGQHIVVYHGDGGAPVTCAAIPQHAM